MQCKWLQATVEARQVLQSKDVKWLPGTWLLVLKQVTGFQNEQPVIKKFQSPQYPFI